MTRVFICYGGPVGLNIGLRLRDFLSRNGMLPFLAGRGSPDIPAGENLDVVIYDRLRRTHVMVSICDLNIMRSKYAREEIQTARDEGILNIPLLIEGRSLPKNLERTWAPIRYDPDNVEASFPQLLVEIHRSIQFRVEKWFEPLGSNPEDGLPVVVLRRRVAS